MKIGIYNQPSGNSIGGSEYSVAVLAEALMDAHEVQVIHHRQGMNPGQLAELFNIELPTVKFRYVDPQDSCSGVSGMPWNTGRQARAWYSELSAPYDLFINFTHDLPPFCHAETGVLMVLFPFFVRETSWPWVANDHKGSFWNDLRLWFYDRQWQERFASYEGKLANSNYSRIWAKRRWDIECEVVYPPVDRIFRNRQKSNTILSVGRFGSQPSKRQLEMVQAFRELRAKTSWEYFSVGTVSEDGRDRDYFLHVKEARGARTYVVANVAKDRLQELFETAKIFWHGSGLSVDQEVNPEAAEHFGIVTVEAMAAGCVPLVQRKGGQAEIVEEGVSGFFWEEPSELLDRTRLLMEDPHLLSRMSAAARLSARRFTKQHYLEGIFASVPSLGLTQKTLVSGF